MINIDNNLDIRDITNKAKGKISIINIIKDNKLTYIGIILIVFPLLILLFGTIGLSASIITFISFYISHYFQIKLDNTKILKELIKKLNKNLNEEQKVVDLKNFKNAIIENVKDKDIESSLNIETKKDTCYLYLKNKKNLIILKQVITYLKYHKDLQNFNDIMYNLYLLEEKDIKEDKIINKATRKLIKNKN